MLLFKKYTATTKFGKDIILDDVYIKIKSINGNKESVELSVIFMFNDKEIETKYFSFIPSLEGDNFIKQGYEYLKTQEEFKNVEDY